MSLLQFIAPKREVKAQEKISQSFSSSRPLDSLPKTSEIFTPEKASIEKQPKQIQSKEKEVKKSP